MAFKTKSVNCERVRKGAHSHVTIVFLVISAFLLSSCEVYQTLYGNSATAPTGQVVSPSENESTEIVVPEETQPTEENQPIEEAKSTEVTPEVVAVKSNEKPFVVVVQETTGYE